MRPQKSVIAVFVIFSPLAGSGIANAAPPDGRLFEPSRAWLERYDPTLISSRYFGEFI